MAHDPDHDRIAQKAHELWEAAGKPHGKDQKHWDEAREIIAVEDSQADTLMPADTGASEPVEEPAEALRNQADFPNLTDQGENLLTSTDREPDLTATPAGRRGRMPKAEVPTSDQPGIAPKKRKAQGKAVATKDASSLEPAMPSPEETQPKTASVPSKVKPAAAKTADEPKTRRSKKPA